MKKLIIVALLAVSSKAYASMSYNNSAIISSLAISTGAAVSPVQRSPYNLVIDLASADSASWQMSMTCAKGQLKIQQSNDGTNFVDLGVAGSSITFPTTSGATGLTTVSNQQFAIASPAYRYINFNITNSSAPAAGVASNCTVTATQLLKSLTSIQN